MYNATHPTPCRPATPPERKEEQAGASGTTLNGGAQGEEEKRKKKTHISKKNLGVHHDFYVHTKFHKEMTFFKGCVKKDIFWLFKIDNSNSSMR
jgi:hypothetical protein